MKALSFFLFSQHLALFTSFADYRELHVHSIFFIFTPDHKWIYYKN